jgi:hypothetical protein
MRNKNLFQPSTKKTATFTLSKQSWNVVLKLQKKQVSAYKGLE